MVQEINEIVDTTTSIEWLILADAAEVVGGKLYVMGGGWDRLTVHSQSAKKNLAVALALRVPWHETNRQHAFQIDMTYEDGSPDRQRQRCLRGRTPGRYPTRTAAASPIRSELRRHVRKAWDLRHHCAGKRLTGTFGAIQHRARPGRFTAERLAALPLASDEGPRDTSVRPPARCSKKTA